MVGYNTTADLRSSRKGNIIIIINSDQYSVTSAMEKKTCSEDPAALALVKCVRSTGGRGSVQSVGVDLAMNFTNPSDCKTNLLPDGSQAPLHAFNTGASVYVGSGFSGLASAFIIITFWYVRQPHLHALRSGAHFVSFLSFFLALSF